MLQGYEALRGGAAWLDLSSRGVVTATGRDRVRLLHNLTSNHIKQLTPGAGCYAFLLNPQGRIQADVNVLCLEDRFLLDTEPETLERLLQHIRRYIIADDVKLEDAGYGALAVEGPGASGVLAAAGAPEPAGDDYSHAAWNGGLVARISLTGQPGFRIYAPRGETAAIAARLAEAGAVPAAEDAARAVRIENGKPRYGEDIVETTLPQETRQLHGLHFTKGCYLGQEIVERIRARGHVNKVLVKLEVEGDQPLERGVKLTAGGGEDAGEVTSSAFSPALGKAVALAYARTAHSEKGTALDAGGRRAVVA